MAFTPIVPVTFSCTVTQGAAQSINSSAIKDPTGAAVDLSAWTALTAKAVPLSPGPASTEFAHGTVTASAAGVLSYRVDDDEFTEAQVGQAKLVITGKPTAGDIAQVLATGTLTVAAG